jgi:hypothetical protein
MSRARPKSEELGLPTNKSGAHLGHSGEPASGGEMVDATNIGGAVAAENELGDLLCAVEQVVG